MFQHKSIQKVCYVFVACALIATAMATVALAQKPGDKVEYKAQNWPEKWEVGVFVKELPGGKQVLIAEKPNDYYPEGFHRAYALNEVRPVKQAEAEPKNLPDQPPVNLDTTKAANAGGLMTQEEIINFLRQRVGDGDPWRNPPRLAQAKQELRAELMRRGVNFYYVSSGKFSDELSKFGATTDITGPLGENYGPPAKLNWFSGTWDSIKLGKTRGNTRFGEAGFFTIGPNGTYEWSSPSGVFKGRWRAATPEELAKSDKGGEGVVLLNAKSGVDWIVSKRDTEGQGGEGVKIADLNYRNTREYAWRR